MRTVTVAVCVALLLGAAGLIVATETWHGPVVLAFSADHGLDTGDLLAAPLIVLAIVVRRRRVPEPVPASRSRSLALPASAMLVGVLLLLAAFVPKAGGGPLV